MARTDYSDNRGWKKGDKKIYSDLEEKRICDIKEQRIKSNYFVGRDYVQMDYANKYPNDPWPSDWFIKEVIRRNNLQTAKPKKKIKGGSKYLLYPEESIKRLGRIQQSGDFIGKKYIDGRTEAINIFSTSYYRPFKLFQIKRVFAAKSAYIYPVLIDLWREYPIPDVYRVDNALTFRGTGRGRRFLSPFLKFILNLDITPLFGAYNKPWTNPHVEGHNKTFGDKVWGNNRFTNLEQIDRECDRFNRESLDLFNFKYRPNLKFIKQKRFLTERSRAEFKKLNTAAGKKIYFIRFVENRDLHNNSFITILNEKIIIPEQYDHQFVFVECDIEKNKLNIYSEFEKKISQIHQTKFTINL